MLTLSFLLLLHKQSLPQLIMLVANKHDYFIIIDMLLKTTTRHGNALSMRWCVLMRKEECFAPPPGTLPGGLSLGGPEGQVAGFNANVFFENISAPDVYIM